MAEILPLLKACPFCAAPDSAMEVCHSDLAWAYIKCLDCGANGPFEVADPNETDEAIWMAHESWNRRTEPDDDGGPVLSCEGLRNDAATGAE